MGDAVDKHCLQNPLDVVEGVAHAGQAAKVAHVFTAHVALVMWIIWLYSASYRSAPKVFVKRIISADSGLYH